MAYSKVVEVVSSGDRSVAILRASESDLILVSGSVSDAVVEMKVCGVVCALAQICHPRFFLRI